MRVCKRWLIFKLPDFQIFKLISGSSSIGRAIAFQAIGREFDPRLPLSLRSVVCSLWSVVSNYKSKTRDYKLELSRCSSGVEHILGRDEVVSSILTNGS